MPRHASIVVIACLLAAAALAPSSASGAARRPAPKPDLKVSTIALKSATATLGSPASYTITHRNAGTATAGVSTVRVYWSSDRKRSANDKLFGKGVVARLLKGRTNATVVLTSSLANLTPSSSWYLVACADDLRKVAELSETNNCTATTAKVTIKAATPPPRRPRPHRRRRRCSPSRSRPRRWGWRAAPRRPRPRGSCDSR